MADGSVTIDTKMDTSGLSKGLDAVKAGMSRISAQVSKMGDNAKNSFQRQITAVTDLYQNYEKQERKVSDLKSNFPTMLRDLRGKEFMENIGWTCQELILFLFRT